MARQFLFGLFFLLLSFSISIEAKKKATEDQIEDVNKKQLEQILEEKDYVAVFWYGKSCKNCDQVLTELEKIDDDTDKFGVDFVKINDKKLAKTYGIKTFPALSYFRNKEPVVFDGDLMDEDSVLEFLTSLDAMELPDQIEEVNAKILEKIVKETNYVAVFFCPDESQCHTAANKQECKRCTKALHELENIDDEADALGIAFVKISDEDLAEEYSLKSLPALVYYRHEIPIVYEGDLQKEEDVLEWLVQNKSTGDDEDVIEDVTGKTLATLIDSIDRLAVLFYDNDEAESQQILSELESIDDECDGQGIQFVKIDDDSVAADYGIDDLPALVFFENEIPNIFEGDLTKEEEVLEWLVEQVNTDEIEDITDEMLDKLIKDKKHLAVLFYDEDDKASRAAVTELENIDDECDQHGVTFVKIDDDAEAKEYGIDERPTLVYFESGVPSVYEGNLEKEENVLKWLLHQVEADEIEDVTDEMLDKLIATSTHLAAFFSRHQDAAVLFYDKHQKKSQKVLAELENIDDECDQHGIVFVKIDNDEEAKEYGIDVIPTLVYFENQIPSVYEGDLLKEEKVLEWLIHQVEADEIEEVTDEMLDKLIATTPFMAVLFYDKDDKQDRGILEELESIDDECDKNGIVFVKIDNDEEAKEYGLDELPTLVYFENEIPSVYEGDLSNENEVLTWIIEQKTTSTIEEVTDELLDDIIEENEYVAVYFSGPCEEEDECDDILEELENIDDDTDDHGIQFVTTEDTGLANKYGVKKFPTLVLFRNQEPVFFEGDREDGAVLAFLRTAISGGDLSDEDKVLSWLTDDDTLEIPNKIEEVNRKMLGKLVAASKHLVVFFYEDEDKATDTILTELENIDDELDDADVDFVKISDENIEDDYGLKTLPSLVYFRSKQQTIYTGDLMNEEAILKWVIAKKVAPADVIEELNRKALDKLLNEKDFVVVLVYEEGCQICDTVLEELENIDDDTDKYGIQFVKTTDKSFAQEFGISTFPSLVYFEDKSPSIYDGDLGEEEEVLKWLIAQKSDDDDDDDDDNAEGADDEDDDDEDERNACIYMALGATKSNGELIQYRCCPTGKSVSVKVKVGDDDDDDDDDDDEEDKHVKKTIEGTAILKEKEDTKEEKEEHDDYGDKVEKMNKIREACRRYDDKKQVKNERDDDTIHEKIMKQYKRKKAGKRYDEKGGEDERDDDVRQEKIVRQYKRKQFGRQDDKEEGGDETDEDVKQETVMKQCKGKQFGRHCNDRKEGNDKRDDDIRHEKIERQHKIKQPDRRNDDKKEDKDERSIRQEKIMRQNKRKQSDIHEVSEEEIEEEEEVKEDEEKEEGDDEEEEEEDEEEEEEKEVGKKEKKTKMLKEDVDKEEMEEDEEEETEEAGKQMEEHTAGDNDSNLGEEEEVLEWIILQRTEETIENINREMLFRMIDDVEYLAVLFYNDENPECPKALRHLETIDDEAAEYGVHIMKMNDRLMAKKYGFRDPPGIVYFRRGKNIKYDGDLFDEEEVLDWLTNPDNMELTDHIEKVNRKMFAKILQQTDYLAALFYSDTDCKQCEKVLEELEHIDDEADSAGIKFVKIDDRSLAKEHGVFALPAVVFFRSVNDDPVIYAGDLKDEERILSWLLVQKDPSGDQIEELSGDELRKFVSKADAVAVYFFNGTQCAWCKEHGYIDEDEDEEEEDEDDIDEEEEEEEEEEDQRKHSDNKKECEQCAAILDDLENIDDDTDRQGISFLKTQDVKFAEDYDVDEFPALLFFEKGIPNVYEGDLSAEEDVLQWLILQKTEDRIETVTRGMLENLLEETQYLAVYFYKSNCRACDQVLGELENIDDECDLYGISMVKIQDPQLAKRYGIKTFPALVYFRNGNPLLFDGDMKNEDSVLEWLIDDESRELLDEIEAVNVRMLEKLLDESPFLAVFFYEDDCNECYQVLAELENIDDEADLFGIDFVKISDEEASQRFEIHTFPTLVYFRKKTPLIYDGDLMDEERILTWLTSQDVFEIKDEIEEVNRKMLDKLMDENDFVAVFFYDNNCPICDEVLEELEHIDDETDNLDITFVKIRDPRYARKYGVQKLPALVYFRRRFPSIYRGDLMKEEEVLDWLQKNRYKHPELNIFMYALTAITSAFVMYTLFLMFCFRGPHHKTA